MDNIKKVQALKEELAETKASLDKRYQELAELTRMLAAIENERDYLREQLQVVVESVDELHQMQPELATPADDSASGHESVAVRADQPGVDVPQQAGTAAAGSASANDTGFSPLVLGNKERKSLKKYLERVCDSELFDASWYLETYPDVKASALWEKPAEHYLYYGGFEGRHPSPNFDSVAYFWHYPDVYDNRFNPLVHYLLHGQKEGRQVFHL